MLIDVEIAGGGERQVEAAVPGEQLQHVVEEAYAGAHVVTAPSVHRERARDLRFRGLAIESGDASLAHRASLPDITDSSASMAASVCVNNPAVTRMQPGVAGSFDRSRTWTPRRGQRVDDRCDRVADADHDEIRCTLPVLETESPARRVEPLARFRHLRRVAGKELAILEGRERGGHGDGVDVEGQRDGAHRIERRGLTDEDPDAHARQPIGLGERAADEDIRVRPQLWQECRAAELDVRLVDEDDGMRRRFSNAPQIRDRNEPPGRIARRIQKDHPGPRRDGGNDRVSRKHEVRSRRYSHGGRADGGRRIRIRIERRQRNDRFGVVDSRTSDVTDGGHQDAFVQPVGQQDPIRIDVEEARAGAHELRVRRIGRDVRRPHALNGVEHARRAATGVLVEVQAQPVARVRISLNAHIMTSSSTRLTSEPRSTRHGH